MSQPIVFISYSSRDEREKDELLSHLGVLRNAGLVDLWSDDRIRPGSDWDQEIRQAISQANIAILLISANFLNSDFILNQQIPLLLSRREREGLIVFPVIAKACAWTAIAWLAKMQVRPGHKEPIWRDGGLHVDKELATIAGEISNIVTAKASDRADTGGHTVKPTVSSPTPSPASSDRYHSCFISYSSKDDDFAQRLHADLQQQGVRCWFAPKNMKIGDKIRQTIHHSIQSQEKLLLILSENSVESAWVETEVETAFEKERKQGQPVLFPIRLDQAVLETDQAWAAEIHRNRHIGDFSRWTEPAAYQVSFKRLLQDLKVEGNL